MATWVLRIGAYSLLAVVVFVVVALATSVRTPPAPRLGHRGAVRHQALHHNTLFATVEPALRFLAGLLNLLPLSGLRARQEVELQRAGYCLGLTADEYLALSLCSASVLGAIVAAVLGSNLCIPGALLGFFLPKMQLQESIRMRVKSISRGLPHSIEIAALCMGAGLDFPGSLRMLVRAKGGEQDPLTEEFASILEELELGHTRQQALLNFAERVRTAAVRDFVNAVVQAEQKGNPLAKVIQVQGRMLNMRRSVAAEEAAARAAVLMMGPMVLQLACILLLLMGPFIAKGVGF